VAHVVRRQHVVGRLVREGLSSNSILMAGELNLYSRNIIRTSIIYLAWHVIEEGNNACRQKERPFPIAMDIESPWVEP
jgi:hypothetical protein